MRLSCGRAEILRNPAEQNGTSDGPFAYREGWESISSCRRSFEDGRSVGQGEVRMFTFAEYLRHRRLSRGMTMQVLAQQLNVTPQFVSLLESGRRRPSGEFIERCAELFGDNVDYLRFLAEPIPEEQKRAIYESPLAPAYIPRPSAEQTVEGRLDDLLIRQMLNLPGMPKPEEDTPYHGDANYTVSEEALRFHRQLVRYLLEGDYSPNIKGWARFYDAYYTRWTEGRAAARPSLEQLIQSVERAESGTYPLRWAYLVWLHTGLARQEAGESEAAVRAYLRAAEWADEARDGEGGLIARWLAAQVVLSQGDIFRCIELLRAAAQAKEAPPAGIARARTELADLLLLMHEDEAALNEAIEVAPLWRSSTLDLPQGMKTSSLLIGEVVGTEALRRMGRDLEARRWLNRVRSVRTRVDADLLTDLRLRIVAAELLATSNRFNQRRKRFREMMNEVDKLGHDEISEFVRAYIRARYAETQLEEKNVEAAEAALEGLPLEPGEGLLPRRLEWLVTVGRAKVRLLQEQGREKEARALVEEIKQKAEELLSIDSRWQGSRLEQYVRRQLEEIEEPLLVTN
ncbi:MAG: hypothetical protein KatS3mg115_1810 [Candidatus Poribacteria bacterium]|nr:MAG: hypothetical protein KatS3mg115_1810 [Candidatus Poribacteria bacterium]